MLMLPEIKNLKYDLPAGLVVFLVALPLCLGIALASGAPLISGIVGGVIGGIIVSLLSGSEVSVSGPAAGLSVIVIDSITKLGAFEIFLAAVVIAGIIQLIFAALRFGFLADYIPISVIQGMLAAIGLVIMLKQIPHALGRNKNYHGSFSFFDLSKGSNTFGDIILSFYSFSTVALIISVLSVLIIIYWERIITKICAPIAKIPASLIAIIIGTLINEITGVIYPELKLTFDGGHLVHVGGTDGNILHSLPKISLESFNNLSTWKIGLLIAFVGSIETLLSIEAADKLDRHHRISNPNQELLAQGVGNICSGFCGGLPLTSVVVRTSANIYAGSKSRYSAFFHGVFLLVSVLLIPNLLNRIPLSALAAILIMVGYKLVNPKLIKKMWALGYYQFTPFIITIIAVVFSDLLTGVFLGFVLGVFFVLRESHKDAFDFSEGNGHYLIQINKDVSFINKAELKDKLSQIPENAHVVIDGKKAKSIEYDIKDTLRDFQKNSKFKHITLELKHIAL